MEKGKTSPWGVSLNLLGGLILVYGFITALMLSMETMPSVTTIFASILLIVGLGLTASMAKSRGDEGSVKAALEGASSWGAVIGVILIVSLIMLPGGGGEMIPESAWPLLMGALTMIGAGFAAAVCIIAAVRAGSEMLREKPELSIWSLLFVALGEGLAIYGLIVAILILTA